MEYPEHAFEHSAVLFLPVVPRDPDVRNMKSALYRAGSKSLFVAALSRAAKNGKEVTVLVELKASFDEVPNCEYARALQLAGCTVMYGVAGLKVHCKAILVICQKVDGTFESFSNVSTGNYNAGTARLYTDFSLYTKRENVASDLRNVFNCLTGFGDNKNYKTLFVAPLCMLPTFLALIRIEARNAREGKPASITCQMNGLTDATITKELYDALQSGVKIDLIVRGTCRLRPGIPGRSDDIRVFSWLGTVLQHRRNFFFENAGDGRFFLGSADWRTRNLHARVEVIVPVEDPDICHRLYKAFDLIDDKKNVWQMSWDGRYYKGEVQTAKLATSDFTSSDERSVSSPVDVGGERDITSSPYCGAVPIKFKQGAPFLLFTARDRSEAAWSFPNGRWNEGEPVQSAAMRLSRAKGGICAGDVVESLGPVEAYVGDDRVAIQMLLVEVHPIGASPEGRKSKWLPLDAAVELALKEDSSFVVETVLRAGASLRSL